MCRNSKRAMQSTGRSCKGDGHTSLECGGFHKQPDSQGPKGIRTMEKKQKEIGNHGWQNPRRADVERSKLCCTNDEFCALM
jgi:hypothetical protein